MRISDGSSDVCSSDLDPDGSATAGGFTCRPQSLCHPDRTTAPRTLALPEWQCEAGRSDSRCARASVFRARAAGGLSKDSRSIQRCTRIVVCLDSYGECDMSEPQPRTPDPYQLRDQATHYPPPPFPH